MKILKKIIRSTYVSRQNLEPHPTFGNGQVQKLRGKIEASDIRSAI